MTRGRGLGAARPADDEGEEEDDDDDCESLPPLEEDVDEIDDDVAPPTASKTPSKTKAKAAAREAAGKTDERALIAALKALGFNAGSIDGLISKVGYATVKEWQALRWLGEAQAKELAADAGLNPAQRGLLMVHMKSMAAPTSILSDLHESADEEEDDEDNEDAEGRTPAPAKGGNPTPTPRAGGRPLVTALVGKVPPAHREEVLGEALEMVYEALNGRLPTAAQRKHVELSLEASLRAIGATVKSVTPASPRSVESVMEAVLELTMGYSPGQKAAGRGGARGAMPVDDEEDDEAAAGWIQGSGKQDLAMQQALNALASDRKAQATVKAMVAMEDAEVLQALSAAGADRNLAALAYKGDAELKPPAGARHTLAMGELMHGVGAVREKVADVLARRVLRPLLPVGSDELALAGKLARGRLDHLDWEKAFGSGAAKSSMGSLGGAAERRDGRHSVGLRARDECAGGGLWRGAPLRHDGGADGGGAADCYLEGRAAGRGGQDGDGCGAGPLSVGDGAPLGRGGAAGGHAASDGGGAGGAGAQREGPERGSGDGQGAGGGGWRGGGEAEEGERGTEGEGSRLGEEGGRRVGWQAGEVGEREPGQVLFLDGEPEVHAGQALPQRVAAWARAVRRG